MGVTLEPVGMTVDRGSKGRKFIEGRNEMELVRFYTPVVVLGNDSYGERKVNGVAVRIVPFNPGGGVEGGGG